MSKPENPGSTDPSSDAARFDAHTASIPEVITGQDPEILPPGKPDPIETGWPVFDVQQIAALPFFLLRRRYGELWEVDDEETQAIAKAWKPILDRYLPLEESELATALLVTAAIVGPRVIMTDWKPGTNGKKPTPPASTKTAGSTASPATSENENPENQAGWDVISKP